MSPVPAVPGTNEGDFILDSEGHGWFWETSVDPSEWIDTGTIRGPQGEPGPAGQDGAAGAAATVAVGNTITGQPGTEADVTNTGTSVNANLIFTIPKGEKGDPSELAPAFFPPLP